MSTEYGNRLRLAMAHAKLNQKQLIAKTGITQSSVSSAMNRASGSSDTPTYARACGVDAHWLATGHGEMISAVAQTTEVIVTGSDAGSAASLAQTLADLAGHLKSMEPDIQRKAMLLISDLVADPDSHATVAAMIELSIRSKNRKAA